MDQSKILVLSILNNNSGSWVVYQDNKRQFSLEFEMKWGEEQLLFYLDKFLKQNNLDLKNIQGLILGVKQASLTQVKIITATINIIGWQYNLPIAYQYYFKEDFEKILPKLLRQVLKIKKFGMIKADYMQKPEITISQKKHKYKLEK